MTSVVSEDTRPEPDHTVPPLQSGEARHSTSAVTAPEDARTPAARTAYHDSPPPQLFTTSSENAKNSLLSATWRAPPDADALLSESLHAQSTRRRAFLDRHEQSEEEQRMKRGRLDLLKQQQLRREAWMAMDAEAVTETAEMLEEMALAVRDRLTSLRPDGYRAFVFHNGDTYEGSWKNCKMHGKGVLRRDGPKDLYEGQWFGGQRSGIGSYHSTTFSFFYHGAWLDNQHHGKGELVEPEGTFAGEFARNVIHGYGEYHFRNGHVYKGEWADGLYHGIGTYLYPSGARYEGQWESGLEHGRGTMLYTNGDTYTGDWQHGYPHGTGTYERCAAAGGARGLGGPLRIEGQWVFGSVHGLASCTLADGSVYSGQWARDQFDGQGILRCPANQGQTRTTTTAKDGPATAVSRAEGTDDAMLSSGGHRPTSVPRATSSPASGDPNHSRADAPHGIVYTGQFRRGRPEGHGLYVSDEVTYEGQWQRGQKGGGLGAVATRGCGTLTIAWSQDLPCGEGVYVTLTGHEQSVVGHASPPTSIRAPPGSASSRRVDLRLVAEGLRIDAPLEVSDGVGRSAITAEPLD